MAETKKVKSRIRSVNNMGQITNVMKMVSGSKLKKAQNKTLSYQPYITGYRKIMKKVIIGNDMSNPFFSCRKKEINREYVLITSDQGLAGSFHNVLFEKTKEVLAANKENSSFLSVGKKGKEFLTRLDCALVENNVKVSDIPEFQEIREVSRLLQKQFLEGTFNEIFIIYQSFISSGIQQPVCERLLPIDISSTDEEPYYNQEGLDTIIDRIVPLYIDMLLYNIFLQAKSSEHIARMLAMNAANQNCNTLKNRLKLKYNRARQAAITREISEIIGGKNALSKLEEEYEETLHKEGDHYEKRQRNGNY